jgi:GT2 family glycosyltransferase
MQRAPEQVGMSKLAISIVLYAPDLLLLRKVVDALVQACLNLSAGGKWTISLDLVNNKPEDAHREELAEITRAASRPHLATELIEAGVNGGYGAGNNVSIRRHPDADYHLVLNPDVLVERDSLTRAIEYLDANPAVGLLTPGVRGFDTSRQYLCKQHPTLLDMFIRSASSARLNRLFASRNLRYEMRNHDYEQVIRPVPYPTGCFMLFRRATLDRTGAFDEGFFLHYEDADIGRRVSNVSVTAYVPSVAVLHNWSRDSHKSWRMRWITIRSGLRYWRKWGGIC